MNISISGNFAVGGVGGGASSFCGVEFADVFRLSRRSKRAQRDAKSDEVAVDSKPPLGFSPSGRVLHTRPACLTAVGSLDSKPPHGSSPSGRVLHTRPTALTAAGRLVGVPGAALLDG